MLPSQTAKDDIIFEEENLSSFYKEMGCETESNHSNVNNVDEKDEIIN